MSALRTNELEPKRKNTRRRIETGFNLAVPEIIKSKSSASEVVNADKNTYEYLKGVYNLSDEHIDETLRTYAGNSTLYAETAMKEKALEIMWNDVIVKYRDAILALPPNAKVLLEGVGSPIRDLVFLTLLRNDIQVIGSDITPQMLDAIKKELTWENFELMANFMKKMEEKEDIKEPFVSLVTKLLALVDSLGNVLNKGKGSDYVAKSEILAAFTDRIDFVQEDVRFLKHEPNEMDMILAIAVYPHLKKEDVIPAIGQALGALKPGGIFHFDLRPDKLHWATGAQGETFRDGVLNGENRFFTTWTLAEINWLVAKLQSMFPGIIVEVGGESTPHPDGKKPGFVQFKLIKPPEMLIAA